MRSLLFTIVVAAGMSFFFACILALKKNRAAKNKSYFYNCYGKEEEFYINHQG
jgi:Na+-transporting NADH:ubiquinone oxidoreductase subunit NqrF